MSKVENLEQLEALYGDVSKGAIVKVTQVLTPLYRKWIETARFCILSTAGDGQVHGSPRGDIDPVVRVHDDKTLLMPDWRGNNRLDCLRDIVTDGRVALLFLIKGTNTTVRVNGAAYLTTNEELRASFEKKGRQPATVIVIDIQEVYTQCAKALMRSELWDWDGADLVPSVGEIMGEVSKGEFGGKDYDAKYLDYAQPRMW